MCKKREKTITRTLTDNNINRCFYAPVFFSLKMIKFFARFVIYGKINVASLLKKGVEAVK